MLHAGTCFREIIFQLIISALVNYNKNILVVEMFL